MQTRMIDLINYYYLKSMETFGTMYIYTHNKYKSIKTSDEVSLKNIGFHSF